MKSGPPWGRGLCQSPASDEGFSGSDWQANGCPGKYDNGFQDETDMSVHPPVRCHIPGLGLIGHIRFILLSDVILSVSPKSVIISKFLRRIS
ncbi:Uncharacterized protein dnm_007730 [Desulfonema magnum]|uniref:Uncharacterized protein n=1 Tax=Desulfonema magnum TaxID=45655 RepID=A0A975BGA9_9BACT|nr:Uncharacterized protein dnm_007730 [Desulfonema magnum]